jgi:hypothetical protein
MRLPDRPFAVLLAVAAAANIVVFFYFAERTSVRVPVYDLLDWLQFYGERSQAKDWLGYLWTPHNEHRIVLSRLLLGADVVWFGGIGAAFALSGFLLLAAMAASVSWVIYRSDLPISWKAAAIPIAMLLLMPAHTVVMISMPAMGVFLHTSAFTVFSFVLLDGSPEQDAASDYRRAAAIIAAFLAAFGTSGGLLIWPVLVFLAWRGGLGWGWIACIACTGAVFIALYLWQMPTSSMSISLDVGHVVRSLDYAIRFLGLPWSHMPQLVWPSRIVGVGILSLGALLLVNETNSPGMSNRLTRVGLSLVLFTLLLAAAAGLARVDIATDREMPVRYGMFVALGHVGLLLSALPILNRIWGATQLRSLQVLIVGLSVLWVAQQAVVGRFAAAEADRYKSAWARFVAGSWTPDMLRYVYPDRDRAIAGLANLRKMGIYTGN